MPSEFWALQVGSGEAFLLRTRNGGKPFVVLVDSGKRNKKERKPHRLAAAIDAECPGLKRIDVAICTHQDSDHAGGFENFAEHWARAGGSIGEYWLPGSWAVAFPSVLTDLPSFLRRLTRGAREVADRLDNDDSGWFHLPERLRLLLRERHPETSLPEIEQPMDRTLGPTAFGVSPDEWPRVLAAIEDTSFDELLFRITGEALQFRAWPAHMFDETSTITMRTAMMWPALDTAASIRKIAISAIRNGARVRWFDFETFEKGHPPQGGEPKLLEPVNAVEILRPLPSPSDLYLLAKLYLSQQNVESLVFHRVETSDEPGVLFLGDSRLAFGEIGPSRDFPRPTEVATRPCVVTAPHHGSLTNDHAYDVLSDWGVEPLFIRNGGHWKSKLGGFTRQLERRCVRCHQCGGRSSQAVRVKTACMDWDWDNVSGLPCP